MSDRRAKKLGEARADLSALPDLLDELARCLTERGDTTGGKPGKISGSPPPLRLDVLHLVDDRRKPGWEGEDPRIQQLEDRYGATATLESWTRVVWEEMRNDRPEMADHPTVRTEASVLIEVWSWIEDRQWAEELAEDVTALTKRVRAALGHRPEYRPRCRYCRDVVKPVDADHTTSTWEACAFGLCSGCSATYPKGPALDALGQVQEPLPLKDVAEMTGLPLATLYRWYVVGAISPETNGQKRGKLFDLAAVRAVASRVYGREAG
jgi:hypothetical protein